MRNRECNWNEQVNIAERQKIKFMEKNVAYFQIENHIHERKRLLQHLYMVTIGVLSECAWSANKTKTRCIKMNRNKCLHSESG